jgi:hypothetical protein
VALPAHDADEAQTWLRGDRARQADDRLARLHAGPMHANIDLDRDTKYVSGAMQCRAEFVDMRGAVDADDPGSAVARRSPRRRILAGPTIWLAIRISRMPFAASTSASPSLAQATPVAPASSSFRMISSVFCPLVCGRQLTPLARQISATRPIFASIMSRSTRSAGVSTAVLGAPISDDAGMGNVLGQTAAILCRGVVPG